MFNRALESIQLNIQDAVHRFPVAALLTLAGFILGVSVVAWELKDQEFLELAMTISTSLFWAVGITLFGESRGMVLRQSQLLALGGTLAFGLLFYLVEEPLSYFCGLQLTFILGLGLAPFVARWVDDEVLWQFNHRLWRRIAFTTLVAFLLWAGVCAILGSADYLLGIKIRKAYIYVWLFAATLFAPIFAMGGIPKRFDVQPEDFSRVINILFGYLLIPMLLTYAVLLHFYTLKIGLAGELPKGKVAYLVCAFGGVGVAVYLATLTICNSSTIAAFFHRTFFWWLVVPLGLMAVGLCERLSVYGMTENRFCILVGWLWLAGGVALHILKRRELMVRYLYSAAVLLILLSSFIATPISAWNQLNRLEAVLLKNGLLQNGQIVRAEPPAKISREDAVSISGQIEYLLDSGKRATLHKWFGSNKESAEVLNGKRTHRYQAEVLVNALGLEYVKAYERREHSGKTPRQDYYLRVRHNVAPYMVSVAGYDYYMPNFQLRLQEEEKLLANSKESPQLMASFNAQTNQVTLWIQGDSKENGAALDLTPQVTELTQKAELEAYKFNFRRDEMTPWEVTAKGKSLDVKLRMHEFRSRKSDGSDTLKPYEISAALLFTIKSVKSAQENITQE